MNPYMQASEWGSIGTLALDLSPANDATTYRPPATFGMRWQGMQLRNGVSQLSSGYQTPTAGDLPYWQIQDRTNPPPLLRTGGPAATPIAVMNVAAMKRPGVLRIGDVLAVARRGR